MIFRKKTYTERELIDGCLKNDRSSQEALYKTYFATMMSMCMKHTGDAEKSKEIINEGFFKVFSKLDKYNFKGSFEGWIRRIMYHSIIDYYRANRPEKQFILPDRMVDKPIQEEATDKLHFEDLLTYVNKLPKASQDVFLLFALEGYKHDEIAMTLGISAGTSKWHLSNARKLLKEMLAENTKQERYNVPKTGQ